MKNYLTVQDAVCDLHAKGFTHDFQIAGNDLLWVQQQLFVYAGDFVITECHQFRDSSKKGAGIVVFGVVALYRSVKGIVIRHYSTKSFTTPPVILKKMNDLFNSSPERITATVF